MPKKILVVDDEELIIKTVSKLLVREGYGVTISHSGREAIEEIKNGSFDLIVTDIRMPELNGIETLIQIRALLKQKGSPKIPEICITGYADEETNKKAEAL